MDIIQSTTLQESFSAQKVIDKNTSRRCKNSPMLRMRGAVAPNRLTHKVFDEIPVWDTFAWNNLIQTYLSCADPGNVVSTYGKMLVHGVRPDRHTLPRVLIASRLWGNMSVGRQVHGQVVKLGFSGDGYVITGLIEMYGRLDSLDSAKLVFENAPHKNAVSWTLLAKLFIESDKPSLALDTFHQLVETGVDIDPVALATAAGACGQLKSLRQGKLVHESAKRYQLEFDELVNNSLLKMYMDCESITDARALFDQMLSKDVISWTSVIQAYIKKGEFNEGLKLFRLMNMEGLKPDLLSVATILPACARITGHMQGKEVHGYLLRNFKNLNLTVHNAIMDMYVKSGDLESASKIFSGMDEKDIITWTIMILGYSLHGQGKIGVDLFHQMEKSSSLSADQITYAAVLHACCTARMVDEGRNYFNLIIKPNVAIYALMVSLLARSGNFQEAREFIKKHNIGMHPEVIRKVLDGYRIHQQYQRGKQFIEQLCDLECSNAENYVLLSNWYAEKEKWDMANEVQEIMRDMVLKPRKAYSWLVFRNKVHVFGTGDVSHPRSEKIYWELQLFMEKMREEGFQPSSDFSLHDVDEERECIPTGHSELLALSFGLITTEGGRTIRVTKNCRVCRGCHESAKFISKVVNREIILKDPNTFHHFKDGICSCEDFW